MQVFGAVTPVECSWFSHETTPIARRTVSGANTPALINPPLVSAIWIVAIRSRLTVNLLKGCLR
jgi:hypothetical protein